MITTNLVSILALVTRNKTVGNEEAETKPKSMANIVLALMIIIPLTVIIGAQMNPPIDINLNQSVAPFGTFAHEPKHPCVDETITFDASASHDRDGRIVSYYWDFGDGTNATGMIVEHSYAETGYYNVRLTVTDNDGRFAIVLRFLNVTS